MCRGPSWTGALASLYGQEYICVEYEGVHTIVPDRGANLSILSYSPQTVSKSLLELVALKPAKNASPRIVTVYEPDMTSSDAGMETVAYMMEPSPPGHIVGPDEWIMKDRVATIPGKGFSQERHVVLGRVDPDLTPEGSVFVAALMDASPEVHATMSSVICKHEPIIRGTLDVVTSRILDSSLEEFLCEPDQFFQDLQSPLLLRMSSEVDFTTELVVRSNTWGPHPDDDHLGSFEMMDLQ